MTLDDFMRRFRSGAGFRNTLYAAILAGVVIPLVNIFTDIVPIVTPIPSSIFASPVNIGRVSFSLHVFLMGYLKAFTTAMLLSSFPGSGELFPTYLTSVLLFKRRQPTRTNGVIALEGANGNVFGSHLERLPDERLFAPITGILNIYLTILGSQFVGAFTATRCLPPVLKASGVGFIGYSTVGACSFNHTVL